TAFHDHYLYRYLELYSADEAEQAAARAEYEQWLPIIAGARLCEGITTLEAWLLEMVQRSVI
ncbi:MAG: hypothetical protein AAF902_21075, partial [Chloroflexota bacterium]